VSESEDDLKNLVRAIISRRTINVALLSFSSGLPLGLVWYAIPDWMRSIGVDIRIVGLFSLAQVPWAFKVLWSPLMDRYVPPFWGRRRGWMALMQVALAILSLVLAGVGSHPDAIWVVGAIALAIALASASQDVAYDAYAVDVLRENEQGPAVGAKLALYRAAMLVSGGFAITVAGHWGWPAVNVLLGIVYLSMLLITWLAPEPEEKTAAPRTLRDAVWEPFLGFLARHRALEILAFVFLYKFADQLAQALTRPFLIDMGYDYNQRGAVLASISMGATIGGGLLGGITTTLVGLGHSLWIFGALQIFSNVGYFLLAGLPAPSNPFMYGATSFELFTSGLGTGAFSVLLLRMTQKRFSATQYALFSSLFALPRLLAGPISGFVVDAVGWRTFFLSTLLMGIPGLVMLARFVPFGVKEPEFSVKEVERKRALTAGELLARGLAGAALAGVLAFFSVAALAALKTMRQAPEVGFDLARAAAEMRNPTEITDWVELIGIAAFTAIGGLFTAAIYAARNGGVTTSAERSPAVTESP
jgi:PAT family beta-lactamase induction signal transducer AmpG